MIMPRGFCINTYLADGDTDGIIYTEVSSWVGKVISIPRKKFTTSNVIEELQRPGLYLLLGTEKKLVYIGEANNLAERIFQHLRNTEKSFVETIICFCSKDDNLTVSHTKYLEQKIIQLITEQSEFRLVNRNKGMSVSLSIMLRAEMDTYFDYVKVILKTYGWIQPK